MFIEFFIKLELFIVFLYELGVMPVSALNAFAKLFSSVYPHIFAIDTRLKSLSSNSSFDSSIFIFLKYFDMGIPKNLLKVLLRCSIDKGLFLYPKALFLLLLLTYQTRARRSARVRYYHNVLLKEG